MLINPDISPSASINQWIVTILTFHFNLTHIRLDGVSRRPHQDRNEEEIDYEEGVEDWHNHLHRLMPTSTPTTLFCGHHKHNLMISVSSKSLNGYKISFDLTISLIQNM
jgi:hypothetical protein